VCVCVPPQTCSTGQNFYDWFTFIAGEIMMSVLWFYRAEHTETERLPRYIDNEIFASRHRDVIPAVCIDDKCYVLTFNEFCR